MSLQAPEWLTRRGGKLQQSTDGRTWLLFFSDGMDYSLSTTPVGDKFGSVVRLTTNGRRLDCQGAYSTGDEALHAGLECLRTSMGW